MSNKKRGLGRGLDALLGAEPGAVAAGQPVDGGELHDLPVDLLERGPHQPRRHFDDQALQELADSIRAQGVVQPLVVRPTEAGRYQIVAGERRWRAAQRAGIDHVPALVRDIPDEAAIAVGLIENLQREDLNPLEAAGALQRLIHEFGLSHQKTAEAVGRSRTAVTNLLRLLELNEDVQRLVSEGRLEAGHAKALAGLTGTAQSEAAARVARDQLTVRQTESLVRRYQKAAAAPSESEQEQGGDARRLDPDVERLRDTLADRLGAPVDIQHSRRQGKGRLVIRYSSLEELDGILGRIR
ncbi:MAG: ParB/RepB/Spo0J family partition protein [Halorhodospira halophila]|uniref:ParB/RepB/Spo0J family partition protein n=1 Tax=Halorhodospira TaxID=85108 RepID=UPI00191272CE|nr:MULTISPECIES: ParB/RepB/Spo0J family partition protein [Halorhodospira]MBK5936320.1 chromosome partitioning protein ParB [Halorhodospira halophila]MBK5943591.1 chromosome partitioning protein ParB [Halorhodospira halophila]MCC3750927.1 ParB/RepB/Spo0J family partition protein [Halorhodospira halophila]MCG5527122.1 ParB/RepB/Spo0J family partition protein [Halorhodospira halophila]MCG5538550.1 ParB/RepB/Spo0J family partition protein [Halorhodospira sp. 9622]